MLAKRTLPALLAAALLTACNVAPRPLPAQPTVAPTAAPTEAPTAAPEPTVAPTAEPTAEPTAAAEATPEPAAEAAAEPSNSPRLRALDFEPFEAALAAFTPERAAAVEAIVKDATIPQVQAAIEAGDLTAEELTLYFLARIQRYDETLRHYLELNPAALDEARASDARRKEGKLLGPLDGIPVNLKDNIETADPMHTTGGSEILLNNVAQADAPLVKSLREAGAVILGKANLSEFAGAISPLPGASAVGGLTVNPHNSDFSPAGSSAGSGASVAAYQAFASVGSETAGSLIAPASWNGVVGMYPSRGLVDGAGVIPLFTSNDTAGPIGRSVTDVALLLGAIDTQDAAPLPDGKRVATIKLLMPPDNAPAIITALLNPLLSGVKVTVFSEAWKAEPCETLDLSKELAELSDCGYVTVPLRHGEANTQTIQLGVVRIRSIGDNPAADPLFMEQGGPGGSTIAYFPNRTAELAPFLKARDVVMVEQRGTRYSKPHLDCPEVTDYNIAVAKGTSKTDDAYLNACKARWDEQTDVSAFGTEESAADMYAVARALGYDQFNYYGVSYGALLGQHVMKQAAENPGMLRSVILDSVVPLDVANIESKDQTASNSLRNFFAACEQDAACNRGFPDLQARYLALLDDLKANPTAVTVTLPSGEKVGMPVDAAVVQRQVFNTLYSHLKTRFLPGILDTMISKRDFSWVAEQLSGGFAPPHLAEGMHLAVTCPTYTSPPTDQPDLLEPAFPHVDFFDGEVESYNRRCAIMAVPGADSDAYAYPTEDIPTLILNGQLDPTTPPQFGEHVGSKLKTAYVFTLPDVGHGQVPDSPTQCSLSIATAFLANPGEAPDSSCIEGLKPIFAGRVTPLDELAFETRTVLTDVVVSLPTQFVDPLGTGLFSDPTDPINQPTGFVQILILENPSVDEALSNLKDPTVIAEDVEIGNYRWKILESSTTLPGFIFRSAATLLPDGERVLKITVGGSPARAEKIIETLMQPALSSVEVR